MPWINPLDRVPQVPEDWANHVIYGGALGVALVLLGFTHGIALLAVFGISAAKKAVDYVKEGETAAMCIGKALVSCAWPLTIWLLP